MATMTVSEANYIFDIVCAALEDTSHRHIPISALRGYDIYQICTAFKLQIANEFLILAHRSDFALRFEEGVKLFDGGPGIIMFRVAPDDQIDSIGGLMAFDFIDPSTMTYKDQRLAREETGASFAEYCKSVGTDDPLYWRKIYARLGLDYTSTSPQDNDPVSPTPCLEDSSIIDHYQEIVFAFADLMAANAPPIGDSSLLPYPKKTILYAIRWIMDHYEGLRKTANNPTVLDLCEKMIPILSYLLTRLARDWHKIEPSDKEGIAELSKCDSFPEWAIPLKLKYINEDDASNEAFEVAIQVMKDRVDFEKQHGRAVGP